MIFSIFNLSRCQVAASGIWIMFTPLYLAHNAIVLNFSRKSVHGDCCNGK